MKRCINILLGVMEFTICHENSWFLLHIALWLVIKLISRRKELVLSQKMLRKTYWEERRGEHRASCSISMRIWYVKGPPGIWGECFLKKNSIGFRLSMWLLSSKHPLLTLIDFYHGIQLLLKITSIISSWLYE